MEAYLSIKLSGSRIELFTAEIWIDYFSISNATAGWEEKLTYGANTLMEPVSQAGL
jgi:hypothetical protein